MFSKKSFSLFVLICFLGTTVYQPFIYSQGVLCGSDCCNKDACCCIVMPAVAFGMVVAIIDHVLFSNPCGVPLKSQPLQKIPKGLMLFDTSTISAFAMQKNVSIMDVIKKIRKGEFDTEATEYYLHYEHLLRFCVGAYAKTENWSDKEQKNVRINQANICRRQKKNHKLQNLCVKKGFDKKQKNFKCPRGNKRN